MMDEGMHYGIAKVDNREVGQAVLTITQDMIETTAIGSSQPDLSWTLVDDKGHFHAWTWDKELPTLTLKRETEPCTLDHWHNEDEDECEGWTRSYYACRVCGEVVEPGRIRDAGRTFIPGMRSWEISVAGAFQPGMEVSVTFGVRGGSRWFGFGRVTTVGGIGDNP